MMARSPFSCRNGSVIVLVLVFIVLLTFIVVAFLEEATGKIKYYGLFHNRDDLRVDAYSALEISLATINQYREIEGALWGPEQGWGDPLGDFGFQPRNANSVTVTFHDESGKLPLASMEYEDLLALFEVLGFDLPEAESLADGYIDWIDEDDLRRLNGFDGDDYEDLDPPYKPANAPVVSWDEFRLIRPFDTLFFDETGRPLAAWNQFKSAVSLYSEETPNINQAPSTVVEYFDERGLLNSNALEDYLNGPDGTPGSGDERLLRSGEESNILAAEGSGIGTEITLLRVRVEASRGDASFVLETLVSWAGSDVSAADTRPVEPDPGDAPDPEISEARDRREEARGSVRTAPALAAELGYPFRFLRIIENRKF